MSLTGRVLTGLVAGLVLGTLISLSGSPALLAGATAIAPLGTLWVNAIQMTVIPLVVSLLVGGIASASSPGAVGRIGVGAGILFVAFLAASALLAAVMAPPLFDLLPNDPSAAATLQETATRVGEGPVPGVREWVMGLIPVNPVAAAANGQMLPLVVFSLIFALAVLRLPAEHRSLLVRVSQAISAAMLVVLGWILIAGPVGVFALALPLAIDLGVGAAGAVVYYMLICAGLCTVFVLGLYPVTAVLGRISIREFARAAAPAQSVALATHSSLASLPPLIGESERIGLPKTITGFFLPLAVSMFRAATPIGNTVAVLFLARLYGVELSAGQVATVAVTASLVSFSIPGIPGGSIIVMAPVLTAAGLPVAGIGILLAVDVIPNTFRTAANVTADLSAAIILRRFAGGSPQSAWDPVREGADAPRTSAPLAGLPS